MIEEKHPDGKKMKRWNVIVYTEKNMKDYAYREKSLLKPHWTRDYKNVEQTIKQNGWIAIWFG